MRVSLISLKLLRLPRVTLSRSPMQNLSRLLTPAKCPTRKQRCAPPPPFASQLPHHPCQRARPDQQNEGGYIARNGSRRNAACAHSRCQACPCRSRRPDGAVRAGARRRRRSRGQGVHLLPECASWPHAAHKTFRVSTNSLQRSCSRAPLKKRFQTSARAWMLQSASWSRSRSAPRKCSVSLSTKRRLQNSPLGTCVADTAILKASWRRCSLSSVKRSTLLAARRSVLLHSSNALASGPCSAFAS